MGCLLAWLQLQQQLLLLLVVVVRSGPAVQHSTAQYAAAAGQSLSFAVLRGEAEVRMGKCEECGQKHASCGLVGDEKRERRWCCACGKQHGAVNYGAKM